MRKNATNILLKKMFFFINKVHINKVHYKQSIEEYYF